MSGHVSSRGKDNQGGTRVKTAMTFKVVAGQAPGSSAIPIDAQVEISGRLASLVETGAALVVKRMTGEFTERLAARCAKATSAAMRECEIKMTSKVFHPVSRIDHASRIWADTASSASLITHPR